MKIVVGEKIKELRLCNSMTQDNLAEKLFVSQSTIAKWEAGRLEPSYKILMMIKEMFNVSMDYIFGYED